MAENMKNFEKMWDIKDRFFSVRHKERMESHVKIETLINLRFNLGDKLVNLKDKIATKRFHEQVELINMKYGKLFSSISTQIDRLDKHAEKKDTKRSE